MLMLMPQTETIHIQDEYPGQTLPPTRAHYTLTRNTDHFEGRADFSAGADSREAQSATVDISIPLTAMNQFLQMLINVPLQTGEYRPYIEHTDDYPSITLELINPTQTVTFHSESQGQGHSPWQITFQTAGTTVNYVSPSTIPADALESLAPYLQRTVLDGLIEQYRSRFHLKFFLSLLFQLFLERKQLGQVFDKPMAARDDKPARKPDVMIVLRAHRERIKHSYLDGIADVVVEIVSSESDHDTKYSDYETLGIPECWLLDPIRREAGVYVLGEDQHYHRAAQDKQGRIASTVLPGFVLSPAIFWQETLPDSQATVTLLEQMDET